MSFESAVGVFGLGGPLVSIATPKLVASLFDQDQRRFPTGLGVAAPSLGTAVALAATNPVLLPLFFFSHALNNWLPEILTDTGQSDNAAGYLSAVSVTVGILGSSSV